ncbi:hypothetical protein C8Q80DRAFT_1269268 [Daedaleopsis nitida]|nr:hypothetical protein C8Q80DRAFT_1269268 [Daedaleopsis nitida]
MSLLFLSRPSPHPGPSRSLADPSHSPTRGPSFSVWPPMYQPPPRIQTHFTTREGLPRDPTNWVDRDLLTYVRLSYHPSETHELRELIRTKRLTPRALWYLQTDHDALTRYAKIALLSHPRRFSHDHQSRRGRFAPSIRPHPRAEHPARRLPDHPARQARPQTLRRLRASTTPTPPPPPSPPLPEEPEIEEDDDVAESVVSDWALDEVPEEALETHDPHEAATVNPEPDINTDTDAATFGHDTTAPTADGAAANSLGLHIGGDSAGESHQEPAAGLGSHGQPVPAADTSNPAAHEQPQLHAPTSTPSTSADAAGAAPEKDSAAADPGAHAQGPAEAHGAGSRSHVHVQDPSEEAPSDAAKGDDTTTTTNTHADADADPPVHARNVSSGGGGGGVGDESSSDSFESFEEGDSGAGDPRSRSDVHSHSTSNLPGSFDPFEHPFGDPSSQPEELDHESEIAARQEAPAEEQPKARGSESQPARESNGEKPKTETAPSPLVRSNPETKHDQSQSDKPDAPAHLDQEAANGEQPAPSSAPGTTAPAEPAAQPDVASAPATEPAPDVKVGTESNETERQPQPQLATASDKDSEEQSGPIVNPLPTPPAEPSRNLPDDEHESRPHRLDPDMGQQQREDTPKPENASRSVSTTESETRAAAVDQQQQRQDDGLSNVGATAGTPALSEQVGESTPRPSQPAELPTPAQGPPAEQPEQSESGGGGEAVAEDISPAGESGAPNPSASEPGSNAPEKLEPAAAPRPTHIGLQTGPLSPVDVDAESVPPTPANEGSSDTPLTREQKKQAKKAKKAKAKAEAELKAPAEAEARAEEELQEREPAARAAENKTRRGAGAGAGVGGKPQPTGRKAGKNKNRNQNPPQKSKDEGKGNGKGPRPQVDDVRDPESSKDVENDAVQDGEDTQALLGEGEGEGGAEGGTGAEIAEDSGAKVGDEGTVIVPEANASEESTIPEADVESKEEDAPKTAVNEEIVSETTANVIPNVTPNEATADKKPVSEVTAEKDALVLESTPESQTVASVDESSRMDDGVGASTSDADKPMSPPQTDEKVQTQEERTETLHTQPSEQPTEVQPHSTEADVTRASATSPDNPEDLSTEQLTSGSGDGQSSTMKTDELSTEQPAGESQVPQAQETVEPVDAQSTASPVSMSTATVSTATDAHADHHNSIAEPGANVEETKPEASPFSSTMNNVWMRLPETPSGDSPHLLELAPRANTGVPDRPTTAPPPINTAFPNMAARSAFGHQRPVITQAASSPSTPKTPAWGAAAQAKSLFSSIWSSSASVIKANSPSGSSSRTPSQEREVSSAPTPPSPAVRTPHRPAWSSGTQRPWASSTPLPAPSPKPDPAHSAVAISPVPSPHHPLSLDRQAHSEKTASTAAAAPEKDIADALNGSILVSADGSSSIQQPPAGTQNAAPPDQQQQQQQRSAQSGGDADDEDPELVKVTAEDADGLEVTEDREDEEPSAENWMRVQQNRQAAIASHSNESDAEDSAVEKTGPPPKSPKSKSTRIHLRVEQLVAAGSDGDASSPTTPTTTDGPETGSTTPSSTRRRNKKKNKKSATN